MFKRLIIVVLSVLVLAIPATWLGAAEKKANVLMITWRGETEAERGFKKGMEEAGYNVDYANFDANRNKEDLANFVKNLDRLQEIDLIYTFGTTVTKTVMAEIKDLPIVFAIVSNPVKAGVVASMESSGNNVTGASHLVPFESQFKALSRVKKISKLGIIYNPEEANSIIARDEMKRLGQENNTYTLVEAPVSDEADIESSIQSLIGKVDYIYLPSDSFIISNGAKVMEIINGYRIPTFSAAEGLVKNGALVGLVSRYSKVGELAAQKAIKVLEGDDPMDVPVSTLVKFSFLVNARTMRAIGTVVPVTVLRGAEIIR